MNKKHNALALLTMASANLLALPGEAAQVADDFSFGVRHHDYDEKSLPDSLGGSKDRYDIDVNQFSVIAPLSEQFELSLSYQKEKMSGASPWYTLPDADGKPLQIMSGASIEDSRTDASVKLRYVSGDHSFALIAATSDEDDYESESFGLEYSQDSEDKSGTFSIAADFSNDDINPVDADINLTRPSTGQSKHSSSLFAAYSKTLNKNTLVQFGFGISKKSGYLSDPYKMVLVDFNLIGDARPDTRTAKTLSFRLRHFVEAADAALHLDYRFYDDNWSIDSHTIDIAWYQNLPWGIQLIPSLRLYSQSESDFYQTYYTEARTDGFYSTDYRLSEYGAYTVGLKLVKRFENWSLSLSGERYRSGGDYGFADAKADGGINAENPALLDFSLVSVGLDFHF